MKWKSALEILCDCKIPIKLKRKFYKIAIRSVTLYGALLWIVKKQRIHKMSVTRMRMLKWIVEIHGKLGFEMRKFA